MTIKPLQSTNRVALARVREDDFGVIPSNPAFKQIRQTSSGIAANPNTVISAEIRPDRQVTDLILVGQQAGGPIGGEIAFGVADDDFEEALQGTWSAGPSISDDAAGAWTLSDGALTVPAGGAAFAPGVIVLLSGFPTATNNRIATVVSATATVITFAAGTFTPETAPIPVGASVRVVGFETAAGDVAAVATGDNALTSTLLDFTTLGLVPGMWLWVGDGDNAGHALASASGTVRIVSVAAHRLTLDRVPAGWADDAGTGIALRVFVGDFLRNASVMRSNTIERQYLDHSPVTYEYMRGMTLNTMEVTANAQAIATYTKTYLGRDAYMPDPMARVAGATDVPAPTFGVLNTSSNVGRIGFDGATIAGPNFVMAATININNNLRAQNAVGSIGAVGIGNGEFTVTGSLNTYFGDKSIYVKIIDNMRTSFDLRVGRKDGNRESMLLDFPTIKLSSGSPSVSGKNADVMIQAGFTAYMDPTLGYTMSVTRFWYLPSA